MTKLLKESTTQSSESRKGRSHEESKSKKGNKQGLTESHNSIGIKRLERTK